MLSVKIGPYHPSLENSLVNTLHALKKNDPLAPLAVVAPTNWMLDRLQERLVLEQAAPASSSLTETGFMNISFMNFSVLANEICRWSGAETGRIVRQTVVYEYLIAGLLRQHALCEPLFKNVQSVPALARSLYRVIEDLLDANVHVGNLKDAVREGFIEGADIQKLTGVIGLYNLFKQKLKNIHISHYADVYHQAASCVQDSRFLNNFKHILAYGFYDLTGAEQDFFGEIFRYLPATLFIPYQKKHPSFAYAKPFFESFVLGMAQDIEELPGDDCRGFSSLMNLPSEENTHVPEFQGEIRIQESKNQNSEIVKCLANVSIINASGKRDEVWTVAKEILKLTEAGYKMEEIGLVARSLDPYTGIIGKIFQENYIPYTTSTHETLVRYPLVKAIRQILLLKREDYYRPMVIELLNSPYFIIPAYDQKRITPRRDLWDVLSRRLGIRGGINCWLSRLKQAKFLQEETQETENDTANGQGGVVKRDAPLQRKGQNEVEYTNSEWVGADEAETERRIFIPENQIEYLTRILCNLSTALSSLPEKTSWTVMSRSIANFLMNYIAIPSEGISPEEQKRDQLIISKIWGLLQTLSILDCLNEEVTQEQFVETFLDGCLQEGLSLGIENGRGVKVLDAMSARGIPFRVLFILGLNEKVFPRAISEEPFMRDHVRRKLSETLGNVIPEKLRGFEEERLLFSLLLNAARERLYLLYERSDEAGKPKIQSHYLLDIIQNIKNISAKNGFQESPDYGVYVPRGIKDKLFGKEISLLTPKEAGIRMAIGKVNPTSFMKAFGVNPDLFERSQTALSLMESYHHQLTAHDGIIGNTSRWWERRACRGLSPTAIETFGVCPFKFFMGKVLELESLEEPEKIDVIAAVDLGSLYHGILKDFYGYLIKKGYFYKKAQEIKPIEFLHGLSQKYFTDIERQIPIPYPILWENKKEEILDYLTKFITWDLERIEQTGYIPTYLERKTHLKAQDDLVKLLSVSSKQGKTSELTIKGKIDRIDLKSVGDTISFRVVDYKSGRPLKDKPIKYAVRGQKLQLPFYIVMAEHLLSEEIKKGHIPKGSCSAVPYGRHLAGDETQRYERNIETPKHQTKLNDAAFVYVAQDITDKKGQNGTPEKTIKGNEWEDFRGQCWETVREFLSYIRDGIFPISPSEDAQKCEWCEFSTVCRKGHQPLKFRHEQDTRLEKYREISNLNITKKF